MYSYTHVQHRWMSGNNAYIILIIPAHRAGTDASHIINASMKINCCITKFK